MIVPAPNAAERTSNLATWISNFIGALTLLTPLISWAFFKQYLWHIIAACEAVMIAILLYRLQTKRADGVAGQAPSTLKGVAAPGKFQKFYAKQAALVASRVDQLSDGYMQLFSEEVMTVEAELFQYMDHSHAKLLAVDLTSDPALVSTRTERAQQRQAFLAAGGAIHRILVADEKNIRRPSYWLPLLEHMTAEQAVGVSIGLRFMCHLTREEVQDFIVYDTFCVMVEARQANASYSVGSSNLYFKAVNLNAYTAIFSRLWPQSARFRRSAADNARDLQKFFASYLESHDEADFDAAAFQRQFLEAM